MRLVDVLVRVGFGVASGSGTLISEVRSSDSLIFDRRGRPGVLRIGAAFFFAAVAGVPADFGGLPRRFGVGATELDGASLSSSVRPFSGTTVVVVFSLRRITLFGVGDWNSFRFTVLCDCLSSASTVTRIFWGDRSSPTSRANVCFRGDGLTEDNLEDA